MTPEVVTPEIRLVARTEFVAPDDVPWDTDADGGEALVEFAGRACYQSWSKPNPRTATNAGYIRHLLDVGHLSVLEHSSASFYITGISRSCTHELIRHRHFSYSQLSQRFVPGGDTPVVVPPAIEGDEELERLFLAAAETSREAYAELLEALDEKLSHVPAGRCVRNGFGRPPGRCCPMQPRPASSSPATTGRGGISSRCAPPNTPTSRSVVLRSGACAACRRSHRTSSVTSPSPHCPTAPRLRSAGSRPRVEQRVGWAAVCRSAFCTR